MTAEQIVRTHPDGSMLTVWVVPGAKRSEVVGYYNGALRVRVAVAAEKGKANRAVIALLEDQLGCRLRLASGAGSRRKRLIAVGTEAGDLVKRLHESGN